MKRIYTIILSFALVLALSIPVLASGAVTRLRSETSAAGEHLAEVMELIITQYVGDEITVEDLTEAALRGMGSILDVYSHYLSAEEFSQFSQELSGRRVGIGISMEMRPNGRIEIIRVLSDSPAETAGIEVGDILVAVDGENITGMTTEAVSALITNPDNPRVEITVERGGRNHSFDILKGEISNPTVRVERLEQRAEAQGLSNLQNYRIVRITSVGQNTGADLRQAISEMQAEGVQGIIIDLRGNGGGYLDVTVDIANQLVPSGTVLQTINQAGRRHTYTSVLEEVPFDNVVVLVNRFTASAAEVIASALQDAGAAVIVGETTFGKGSVQVIYSLGDGGVFILTAEIYFRRNGGEINGIGVTPDIEITRSQTIGGPDNVLRRGLEELIQ